MHVSRYLDLKPLDGPLNYQIYIAWGRTVPNQCLETFATCACVGVRPEEWKRSKSLNHTLSEAIFRTRIFLNYRPRNGLLRFIDWHWVQLSHLPISCRYVHSNYFLWGSKNEISHYCKMVKMGYNFPHKILYFENYSNPRIHTSKWDSFSNSK